MHCGAIATLSREGPSAITKCVMTCSCPSGIHHPSDGTPPSPWLGSPVFQSSVVKSTLAGVDGDQTVGTTRLTGGSGNRPIEFPGRLAVRRVLSSCRLPRLGLRCDQAVFVGTCWKAIFGLPADRPNSGPRRSVPFFRCCRIMSSSSRSAAAFSARVASPLAWGHAAGYMRQLNGRRRVRACVRGWIPREASSLVRGSPAGRWYCCAGRRQVAGWLGEWSTAEQRRSARRRAGNGRSA